MIQLRKALFYVTALLLVMTPFSVFAETKNNEITYVAIGDSLTAGLLSDGKTQSSGFVAPIQDELSAYGYDVTVHNLGGLGAETSHVLEFVGNSAQLPEHADIVTISAGANDVLAELDFNKIKNVNLEQWNEVNDVIHSKIPATFAEVNSSQNMESFNEVDTLKDELITKAQPYVGFFPELGATINELQGVNFAAFFSNVKTSLAEAESAYSAKQFDRMIEHTQEAIAVLEEVDAHMEELLAAITTIKSYPILDDGFQQNLEQLEAITDKTHTDVENVLDQLTSIIDSLSKYQSLATEMAELQQMFTNAAAQSETIGRNMVQIINTLKQQYPEANIYVMGYYNAMPYLPQEIQENYTNNIVGLLNGAIRGATDATGVTFVETYSVFAGQYEAYLPNPDNIHPSEAGYKQLANAFLLEISTSFPEIKEQEVVEVSLGETIEVQPGQLIHIKEKNVQLFIPNTIEPGTTLTVTETEEDILAKAEGLQPVGPVLHFHFDRPVLTFSTAVEDESMNELYTLTFGYEHDSDDVAIYHYNDESGQWEKVGGEVNEATKEVTVQVEHFSNYGVFVEVSEEAPIEGEDPTDDGEEPLEEGTEDENRLEDETDDEAKTEEDDEKVTVAIDDDKKEPTTTKIGSLPKTATNLYTFMFIGAVLIGLGAILYVVVRRKKIVE